MRCTSLVAGALMAYLTSVQAAGSREPIRWVPRRWVQPQQRAVKHNSLNTLSLQCSFETAKGLSACFSGPTILADMLAVLQHGKAAITEWAMVRAFCLADVTTPDSNRR